MAERLGLQSDVLQEPSDRSGNVGQNSTSREPQITNNSHQEHVRGPRAAGAAALGGLALLFLSVACGDGRAESPKTPVQTPQAVERTATPQSIVEDPIVCEVTLEKLDAMRTIGGKNYLEAISDENFSYRGKLEPIQVDDDGNRKNYLWSVVDTHGGSGFFVEVTDIRTGKPEELRTKDELFDRLFPKDPSGFEWKRIKVGDESKAAAYAMAGDGTLVTDTGKEKFDVSPTNSPIIQFDLGKIGYYAYSKGPYSVTRVHVTAHTESSPDLENRFPINVSTAIETLPSVEGPCK